MKSVVFRIDDDLLIPDHLDEDARQFSLVIDYEPSSDIERALKTSGLSWNSIDHHSRRIWGGSVFRRPGKPGYWILRAPCLRCYLEGPPLEKRVIMGKMKIS